MNIQSLEINLFKASEIKDGDIILIKINEEKRSQLKKEDIKSIYDQIQKIVKKDISIYFFSQDLSIDIIKNHVKNIEDNKEEIVNNLNNNK